MSRKQGRAAYDDDDLDDYDDDYDAGEDDFDDSEQLNATYDAVADVVGETFSEDAIVDALRECKYNPERAVERLLSPPQKQAPAKKAPGPAAGVTATPKATQSAAKAAPPASKGSATPASTSKLPANSATPALGRSVSSNAAGAAASKSGPGPASLAPVLSSFAATAPGDSSSSSASAPVPLPPVPEEIRAHYAREERCEGGLKPRLSVVTIGHVDAGKSTLMGHLLFDLGVVSARQLHKFAKEARDIGKASFAFAWVLDEEGSERERGVTMDVGTNAFETPTRSFTLLDAPGHRDFVPNTITAISQADVAILVLDASPGEFEMSLLGGSGAAGGQAGQAKEHALLARNFGIQQLVVAVNKMDGPMVRWSQARFNEIVDKATPVLQSMGFKKENVTFVPVSGLTGINLVRSGEECQRHAAASASAGGGSGSGFSSALRASSSAGSNSSSGLSPTSSGLPSSPRPQIATSWSVAGAGNGASPALSPTKKASRATADDDDDDGGKKSSAADFGDMLEGLGLSSSDVSALRSTSKPGSATPSTAAEGEGGLSRQASTFGTNEGAAPTSPTAGLRAAKSSLGAVGSADSAMVEKDIAQMLFTPDALKADEIARLTAWYTDDKPTIMRALESVKPPARLLDKPLRMCVSDVYRAGPSTGGSGITVAGRIEGGWIKAHEKVMIVPGSETASVKSIMINGKQVPFAAAGDNVDLLLGGLEHNEAAVASLRPGSILCWPSHPIRMVSKFKAQIATFPGLDMPIVPGQQLMYHAHTLEEPCNVTKLLRTLDREGHTKEVKPRALGKNTVAVVRLALTRPVCAETFAEHKRLGRFMLRYGGATVAAGMVTKIKR